MGRKVSELAIRQRADDQPCRRWHEAEYPFWKEDLLIGPLQASGYDSLSELLSGLLCIQEVFSYSGCIRLQLKWRNDTQCAQD